jgi:hypothetical protein
MNGRSLTPAMSRRSRLVHVVACTCSSLVAFSIAAGSAADEDGPDAVWKRDLAWLTVVRNEPAAGDVVVSPTGDDAAAGTADRPVRTLTAARNMLRRNRDAAGEAGFAGPVVVWLRGGRHQFDHTLTLEPRDGGTQDAPVVYRSWPGERAIFDGAIRLPLARFTLVTGEHDLARLHPQARGHAVVATIDDQRLQGLLASTSTNIDIDGAMGREARFPNHGFAHVGKILDRGAVYCHGRTPGEPPRFSVAEPIGGRFPLRESHEGDWLAEVAWNRHARLTGYLMYDWYRETLRIAAVDAEGVLTLDGSTRYGVQQITPVPRRVFVTGLLGEMDAPGEWFFDRETNRLFVMPPATEGEALNVWAGPSLVAAKQTAYVAFVDIDITGVADARSPAVVTIEGCDHVVLAGCTIRNSSRKAAVIRGGASCGLQSCDIYDVTSHVTVEGGDARTLTPCRHFVDNCHFTQVEAEDFYGGVAIRGVGIRFTNNLVHNFPGQPVTPGGNDQLLARNEIFNVGFTEGDGGAIYASAAPWGGYGQVVRHNFVHHLICTPQLHPRGGIYFDQLYGGPEVTGNVLYKAAHRAILVNGGAGVLIRDNVVVETPIGIYQTAAYAQSTVRDLPRYAAGELPRGDVGDYLWRMEQAIGPEGWNRPPWSERFPRFAAIMNQPDQRRFAPIGCELTGSRFCRNEQNFVWRIPAAEPAAGEGKPQPSDLTDPATVTDLVAADNHDVPWDVFRDPEALDFSPAAGREPELPEIPFAAIGLYQDAWRRNPPDKHAYRTAVREFFANIPSYAADARYRLEEQAAGGRRLDSGRLFFSSDPPRP